MLSGTDQDTLIHRCQVGDPPATDALLQAFMPLIHALSKRFFLPSSLIAREELVQAGCVGLLRAVKKYEYDQPASLSTYAFPWIIGEMRRTIRCTLDTSGAYDKRRRIAQAERRLSLLLGREPSVLEIAKECRLDAGDVVEAMNACARPSSQEQDACSALDQIASTEDMAQEIEIRLALEKLDHQARALILLRYFRDQTQQEAAKMLGKSQAQISRIERRALDELRRYLT